MTVFSLLLISGWLVSATAATTVQNIIDQVTTDASSGQIFGAGTADDLTSMLNTINTYLASGDTLTARSLLDGFVNAVHQMSDVLMSAQAADRLISQASSVSMSL
ncbi:MAG TPA: hypothetical protein VML36_00345 [Nitrospiria bacterium]|nr:hypothetical protein [Nitrospiria bacterium]